MDLVLVSCNEIKCTCPYLCIGDSWWGELQGSRTRWYIRMVTCCLLLKPQKCPATSAVTVHYLRWYPYHRSANAVLRLPLSHLTNVVQSYITEHLLDLACFMWYEMMYFIWDFRSACEDYVEYFLWDVTSFITV